MSNPPDPATPPVAPPVAPVAPAAPPEPAVPPVVPPVDVAALQARLVAFEAAEVKRAEEQKAEDDAELSKSQILERDLAAANLRLARAEAIAAHPVPTEYQSQVHGTDAASFLASAKFISELAAKAAGVIPPPPKLDPVPGSGTGTGAGGGQAPGSISELRQQIAARKIK